MRPMHIVFLENHDSFSWNVIDALPASRSDVSVVSPEERRRFDELLPEADAVVIGPGPLDPERAGLVQFVLKCVERSTPLLGICLGYQAIGLAFGARLHRTDPVHGRRFDIRFGASRHFAGIEGVTTVMRYHSLCLTSVRSPLRVIARTDDGLPMAIEHETLPIAGLQFHPDSFGTPRGTEMIASFFRAAVPGVRA
jgi:anthranilate synthase/aminodeoxychorismate synthase-like glutamine amidotransferase